MEDQENKFILPPKAMRDRNAGYAVKTKSGNGRTYHHQGLVNGKVPVFLEDGTRMLCNPDNIECIGYID